jgi:hypothetical protein
MTSCSLTRLAASVAMFALLVGCGSNGSSNQASPGSNGARLVSMAYGRIVDVYAFNRVDATRADRRDSRNRTPLLVARDVVIRPDIENQELFDASGNARLDANYRFLPFDVEVGHPELVILWDNKIPPEKARFESALARATDSLPEVPSSFRGQNTAKRPIPVVPRNAAICLNFDRDLDRDAAFFTANPNAIQLLEFINPRTSTLSAFRPVPARLLTDGDRIILDTSLIGGEASQGRNTPGMPSSLDSRTANIRIALPTSGVIKRQIEFAEDSVVELNGKDSRGENAVIRDFRSGNLKDGPVGALADAEKPMVVTHLKMGITSIDVGNRVLTINKRNQDAVIRGRIPYVDGAMDKTSGLALGPVVAPLKSPLRSGDVIFQGVTLASGEVVRVRAEVVMNLDVGNSVGDPNFHGLGMYRKNSDPSQPGDGGQDAFVRVQVTNLTVNDRQGNPVSFESNSFPLGQDCEVRLHYYENVPYKLQYAAVLTEVSDRARLHSFLSIDPPAPPLHPDRRVNKGELVDPHAAVALRFSEPMNLDSVGPLTNFLLTNETVNRGEILEILKEPKPIALALIATKLLDHSGDGTLLQLRPPLGHFHDNKKAEGYWFHMVLGKGGPQDMSGNLVDIFDRRSSPIESFSIPYALDANADSNPVGSRVFRFTTQDEDGSAPGSQDMFGQFQLLDGELRALPVSRFSAVADSGVMVGITRYERGECDLAGVVGPPATPARIAPFPPGGIPGILYSCPSMVAVQPAPPLTFQPPLGPQIGGGVSEPHNQRGSRLQMTYREDDFGLGYRDANKYMLDIEQMHWATFNDADVRFDVFDRYSLRMAHSDWRPDLTFVERGGFCVQDCFSGRSGLRTAFDSNVLEGSNYEQILKDQKYEMNPNDAFRASTGVRFVPYPKFQKSYTWRDPRHVTWDTKKNRVVGLGGAHQPAAPIAVRDVTTSCSSPYVPDKPPSSSNPRTNYAALHVNTKFVFDYGDNLGFRTRDHDPIFLPLLLDFSVYPDGPANGGAAKGTNQFHIALVGPCWTIISPGGYYSQTALCTGIQWPEMRAHTTGGIDQITGRDKLVNPDVEANAKGGVIKDIFWGDPTLGLWKAPPKDDHVHWAQADFVRKVSMVTYGFFDTLKPNGHDFKHNGNTLTTSWRGLNDGNGLPNLSGLGAGVVDLVTLMDPPLSQQPVGTSVVVEYRGAQEFDNDDRYFSQPDDLQPAWNNLTLVKQRGNLLNPYYACEAYRYAMANEFDTQTVYQRAHTANWPAGARVKATGLTPYVTEDRLDSIRYANGLLPRFLNYRIILENNVTANPPLSPRLRSFALAFRVGAGK